MDSHEFVELYRGDKDLRVGKMLVRDHGCEFVQLGTNIASPADSRVYQRLDYPISEVGLLPDDYYLLLMKSKLVFHRKGNISLGGFFRWTPGIIREIIRWKPDIIFENPYLTLTPRSYQSYIAARLLGIPLVYLDAGDILPNLSLKHKLVLPFERRVVNHAAAIITYNEAGKYRFISKYGYPVARISVIPKPVNTAKFHPELNHERFTRKHHLQGKFVVAYFGRLCSNKGARVLLEAADIMRHRGSDRDIVFLFVGGNVEQRHAAAFKDHVQRLQLDTVRLTGMVSHESMPEAYAGVNVAVFPDVTNLPGFSTVLAESISAGLPIIIGNQGWESATPIVDGETGLVIEPRNPRALADHIELLHNNITLRYRLGANARAFAVNEMDYGKAVHRYYDILTGLTGRRDERYNDRNRLRQLDHSAVS